MRILRRRSLERRLFGWMLALALIPSLLLVLAGTWLTRGSLDWMGALGPWDRLAESGRVVIEVAQPAAQQDTALARAIEHHRAELTESLLLARRWQFIGSRLAAALPLLALGLAFFIGLLALAASRALARELARPIGELHDWAIRLGREEPLPPPLKRERREVREVSGLREALRSAAEELSSAKSRALEAERVRLWGEIARRVAHEMKNALTPLTLAARRLRSNGTQEEEAVAVIESEARRLEELARQFAALGRPPEGPPSEVDVAELLESLLASDLPPGLRSQLSVEPGVPLVLGHYDALARAFRNLIRNAVDAMEGRTGEIDVSVSVTSGANRQVEVRVADRGPGLPAGAAARIFEPDFTTKSAGTGLGLALVQRAAAAHGGEVLAQPRAGGGAVFLFRLPAANDPASH